MLFICVNYFLILFHSFVEAIVLSRSFMRFIYLNKSRIAWILVRSDRHYKSFFTIIFSNYKQYEYAIILDLNSTMEGLLWSHKLSSSVAPILFMVSLFLATLSVIWKYKKYWNSFYTNKILRNIKRFKLVLIFPVAKKAINDVQFILN
jgi:hypothetical protein